MAFPEYNGFSLNDINRTGVIASRVNINSTPDRQIEIEKVSRRPGGRVLNSEFDIRKIQIEGYIMGNSSLDLQNKIDNLNSHVTSQNEGLLAVSTDRQGTALVSKVNIDENPYNTDYVPYSLDLIMPDPFFYGGQNTATFTLPSGETSVTTTVTISGSYYCLPTLTIDVLDDTGPTATTRIDVIYGSTNEIITWSGASGEENISYSDILQFDFNGQIITRNSEIQNSKGAYADFYPGERSLIVTFSGAGDWPGGDATISYQPRYL